MAERVRTRFLVVGSGVAGLHTALRASSEGDVMVLTKRSLFDSATAYAQGGIAAALGAGDSPALHRRDTLAAGAALSAKRGKKGKSSLRGASKGMYESMSTAELKKMAKTRRKGLPTKKSSR